MKYASIQEGDYVTLARKCFVNGRCLDCGKLGRVFYVDQDNCKLIAKFPSFCSEFVELPFDAVVIKKSVAKGVFEDTQEKAITKPCDLIKVGQFVRMNKPNTMPFKWHNVWVSNMDKYEGRIGVVCEKPDSSGIAVRFFDGEMPARYPCNALAQVSEAEARREYPLFLGNTVYLYEDIKDDFGTVLVKARSPMIVKAFENELVEISRPGHDFVYRVPWWSLYTKNVTIENYWNPTKGQDVLVREDAKTNWMKAKLLDFQTVNIAVTDLGVFHCVMPLEGHESLQGTDNMPEFVKAIVMTNI